MRKVLICCTYWEPNISGVTQYALTLRNLLDKKRFDVKILTSNFAKVKSEDNDIKRSFVLFKIGKGVFMPFWFVDSFFAVKNTDVVNIHMPQMEAWIVCLWAKIFGKKIIITHHCEFGLSGNISNKTIAVVSFVFTYLTYYLSDSIVSYTQDYAKNGSYFLKKFYNKVEFCLPPVTLGTEDREFSKILESLLTKNKKYIGFAGRIAWEKGLDILIDSVKNRQDIQLVFAGPFAGVVGDSTFLKIKPLLNNLVCKPVFLGSLDRNRLVSFYKKINLLVLPSTNNLETFGIVQAEAMLCGKPVVASNLPGVRVAVELTGMGEIAKAGDSLDLAKKIDLVLKNNYKNTSNKYFKIDDFVKTYENIFTN